MAIESDVKCYLDFFANSWKGLVSQDLALLFDSMPKKNLPVFLTTVLEAARKDGRSEREISRAAVGQPTALASIRLGKIPSVERARALCEVLNLEFYIGPPRGEVPSEILDVASLSEGTSLFDAVQTIKRRLERGEAAGKLLQDAVREIYNIGEVAKAESKALQDGLHEMRDELMAQLTKATQAALDETLSRLYEPSIRVAEDPAPYDSAGPIRLLPDDGEAPDTGTDEFLATPYARDLHAAAGTGEMVFEEAAPFRFAFPRSILPKWVHPDSLLCIRTKGDSMEPTLNDGDLILLDYSRTDPLDGQIFVLRDDDGLVVKRLRGSGFDWELVSDNPAYPPRRVSQEDRLIGRLAWSGPISDRTSV